MTAPLVTIIIATYNRPDTLHWAIESALLQDNPHWHMLVVGDKCSESTADCVSKFADERIRYVNLSQRFGEQGGPTSVGMQLAQTEYIALLNHDDCWLPNHLSLALDTLNNSMADFYISRAAFTGDNLHNGHYSFLRSTPAGRSYAGIFSGAHHYFEPTSSWVLRRNAALKVGPWQHSSKLYRTPLNDWALRAWRCNLKLATTPEITCIKNNLKPANLTPAPLYHQQRPCLDEWVGILKDGGHAQLLAHINKDEAAFLSSGGVIHYDKPFEWIVEFCELAQKTLTPDAAEIFYNTGIDAFTDVCRALNYEMGWFTKETFKKRTGETLGEIPTLAQMLAGLQA